MFASMLMVRVCDALYVTVQEEIARRTEHLPEDRV
jgi:hypothetical protein